ncbi:MAG: ATP-binding cassette domain-containing protein [Actinomycetota bacterium]|jgi:putative ABC transport system ATP-binding protein|nr:ATP-binding cassette domain-containing protein [Actinomycetota bacterium]
MPVLLSARNVCYSTQGDHGSLVLLDGIELHVSRGEVVDVSGPSGSGKTTLLRVLAQLLPESTADLSLSGESADSMTPQAWRSRVALLPQKPVMRPGTVRDNLLVPWTFKVRRSAVAPTEHQLREALDDVGLHEVSLERDAARLSVGQAARVSLLRVVLTGPEVLLLDEPDASLDDVSAEQVAAMIRAFASAGGGVVRVRHSRADSIAARRLRLHGASLREAEADER